MKKTSTHLLLSIALIAVLAGCTQADAQQTPAEPGAQEPAPAAEETVDEPAWTAPVGCLELDLTPDAVIEGAALGACVQEALPSWGTGREHVRTSTQTGEFVFRYVGDGLDMQGAFTGADGTTRITTIGGTMWLDSGDGWVKGDVDSDDPQEMMIGVTAELYKIYADPAQYAQLIQGGAQWRVGPEEDVVLGSGETVRAFPIAVTEPFTWHEIPVDASTAWFSTGWVPVGVEGTVTLMGITETTRQTWYDLGEPVEITPVG